MQTVYKQTGVQLAKVSKGSQYTENYFSYTAIWNQRHRIRSGEDAPFQPLLILKPWSTGPQSVYKVSMHMEICAKHIWQLITIQY